MPQEHMSVAGREFRPVPEREESGQAAWKKQQQRVKKASRMRTCPRRNSGASDTAGSQ